MKKTHSKLNENCNYLMIAHLIALSKKDMRFICNKLDTRTKALIVECIFNAPNPELIKISDNTVGHVNANFHGEE